VKWVVENFLPYGCLTMLIGSQGSMKSLLAMFAAQAVGGHTPGRRFLGRKVMHGIPVLYVDRENPEGEISNRSRHMGVLGNKDFIYWVDAHKGEQTPEIDDPRLMEFAHRENGLIVFDSLQDWYGDENENDNSAMVKLIGKFRKLARAGAGVLLLHHKNAAGERARGGTSITSLTDMAIKAGKKEDNPNVIELREERFRMCGGWEIDYRAHWDAGPRHDFQKHYQVELLRDQLTSDVIREKKAKKDADSSEDIARVVEAIKETGNAPSTLGNALCMDRKKLQRIAKAAGYTWDKETETWKGEDFG
jgi:hypothetical protein